jgi:hypothetical protein
MPTTKTRAVMNGNEPAVIQPSINGWTISWNPDDNRWYVQSGDDVRATFRERRNAVQYARTHKVLM